MTSIDLVVVVVVFVLSLSFQMKEKKCDSENNACYAVWHLDSNGTQVIELQGCWTNIEKQSTCNEQNQCINNKPHAVNMATHARRFCCCTDHMCNVNLTERNIPIFLDSNIFSVDNAVGASYNETLLSALKSQRLWIVVLIISIPLIEKINCSKTIKFKNVMFEVMVC